VRAASDYVKRLAEDCQPYQAAQKRERGEDVITNNAASPRLINRAS
jgi:hypothetical protein